MGRADDAARVLVVVAATGADGVWRYYATVKLEGDDVVPVFPYMIGAYRSQPEVTNFPAHQRAGLAPPDT